MNKKIGAALFCDSPNYIFIPMIGKAIDTKENETEGGFYYDWNFYCPDFRGADEHSGSI